VTAPGVDPAGIRPRGLVTAGLVVAALSFVAGTIATGDVRVDGSHGDWRGATEGLYKSGQPGILGAGRRAIVHVGPLDGAQVFMHGLGTPAGGVRWAGFDRHRAGDWLRVVTGLYAPLFLPPRYEAWWSTPLRAWPSAYLIAAVAMALAAWWLAQRGTPMGGRAASTGLLWPAVTALPLLGLSGLLDLYRVGYLVAVAVGFVVAGITTRIESSRAMVVGLAVALAAILSPLSLAAARAWGREGFQVQMALRWEVTDPKWLGRLTPEMARLFLDAVERDRHAMAWAHPELPWP
jgi:hypothetical protein